MFFFCFIAFTNRIIFKRNFLLDVENSVRNTEDLKVGYLRPPKAARMDQI